MFSEITANAVIVLPTKVTPAFTLEHRADDRLQRYEEINDIQNKMRNKWRKSLYFGGGKNKMYMNFSFSGVIY